MPGILASKIDTDTASKLMAALVDVTNPKIVEVATGSNGETLWVNINGICVLRCCQIQNLYLPKTRANKRRK